MKIKGNYHTHSRWCRHGFGEFEDYIHRAIDAEFEELAFTEHVPHKDFFSFIKIDELPEFDRKLNEAISRYSDKIKIIKGFECEYYVEDLDFYRHLQEDLGYEFLILGQHFSGKNHEIDHFEPKDTDALYSYTQEVIAGMETGMFKILAHPDLLLHRYKNEFDKHCEKCLNDIYECASKNGIVCEINCGGLRNNRRYPSKEGLEISKKYDIKYIIGADAHDPRAIMGDSTKKAIELVKEMGIEVMPKWEE